MGIGKRIREARERIGLTQKELAHKIGVTSSAIANYENDTSHPKEPVLYSLIDALDIEPNFLFQDCVNVSASNTLTPEEYDLVLKFKKLDSYSKKVVLSIIELELERGVKQS